MDRETERFTEVDVFFSSLMCNISESNFLYQAYLRCIYTYNEARTAQKDIFWLFWLHTQVYCFPNETRIQWFKCWLLALTLWWGSFVFQGFVISLYKLWSIVILFLSSGFSIWNMSSIGLMLGEFPGQSKIFYFVKPLKKGGEINV